MITTPQENSIFKRKRSTKSGPRHLPLFRRVAKTAKYAPACTAIHRLARELIKIGQTDETIVTDLAWLNGAGIGKLVVLEIVTATRREGHAA